MLEYAFVRWRHRYSPPSTMPPASTGAQTPGPRDTKEHCQFAPLQAQVYSSMSDWSDEADSGQLWITAAKHGSDPVHEPVGAVRAVLCRAMDGQQLPSTGPPSCTSVGPPPSQT